jgi:hypothetical protein
LTATALQFGLCVFLIIACWAIAPALICERRLRALDAGRGWGLVVGIVFGPLGVATVNLYISERYMVQHTAPHTYTQLRHTTSLQSTKPKLSIRGDLLALACLWAVVLLGSTLLNADTVSPAAQVAIHQAGHSRPSSMPTQGAATTLQVSGTIAAPREDDLSLQTTNRPARLEATVPEAGEQRRLRESLPTASLAPAASESTASPAPTAPPAQRNPSTPNQSAGTSAATAALSTSVKPTADSASAGELMQLVVPANLRAHGTISGMGSATTLTIACADCTYELGAERLRDASSRATLKAAGVHIVVLINGQDSWTFML